MNSSKYLRMRASLIISRNKWRWWWECDWASRTAHVTTEQIVYHPLGCLWPCSLAWSVPIGIKLYNSYFLVFKGACRGGTQSPPSSPCRLARWSQRIGRERIACRAPPLLQWNDSDEREVWMVGKLSPPVQWAVTDQCETGNSCTTCFVQATCSSPMHAPWPLSMRHSPGNCIVYMYIMGCFQVPPPTFTSIRPLNYAMRDKYITIQHLQ